MDQKRVNQPRPKSSSTPELRERLGRLWRAWIDPRRAGGLNWLLLTVPLVAGLELAGAGATWRFLASAVAIIPLAGLLGRATEDVAHRLGPGIGGLLNATFGNAAELIIALFALSRGLDDVVKASLTGSIIGNLLLVLGASLLAGGLTRPVQYFNRMAAGAGVTLATIAAVGLLLPAIFHQFIKVQEGAVPPARVEHALSVSVCVVLMLAYALSLVFSLGTHRHLYCLGPGRDGQEPEGSAPCEDPRAALKDVDLTEATIVLLASTAGIAWMSEVLVGAVEAASRSLGLGEMFVGVIVVAIVGNAAEHSTAILMARKDQMDLAVGIAVGSAIQIALFVAPVLVFASYLRAEPMDLLFTTLEVVAVVLAVLIARMVAEDGESNWLEGAMLLMVYALLGIVFFFVPVPPESRRHRQDPRAVPDAAAGRMHRPPGMTPGAGPGRTKPGP